MAIIWIYKNIEIFDQVNNPKYKILCKNVLDNFCKNNNEDGSCSYSNLSKDLKSITPYYHSRCLAFMKYSINNLNFNSNYYNDIFLQGASFLTISIMMIL